MKLLQYLILTILIANGSLPLVQDVVIATGNEQLIRILVDDTDADCGEQETDGEDANDDELVDHNNPIPYEPKPHDSSTKSSAGGQVVNFLAADLRSNFNTADWTILPDNQSEHICSQLLRHTYFSKRRVDIS